jgi:hypothetical protein
MAKKITNREITIEDIYREYNINSIQYLFAGGVIEKMANKLIEAHRKGLILPSEEESLENLPEEYNEFKKMLKVGIPINVIATKMKSKNLDPSKILKLDDDFEELQFKPFLENINIQNIDLKKTEMTNNQNNFKSSNQLLEDLKERLKYIRERLQEDDV